MTDKFEIAKGQLCRASIILICGAVIAVCIAIAIGLDNCRDAKVKDDEGATEGLSFDVNCNTPEPIFIVKPTFGDLLDAIEWVESGGDCNTVGDGGKAVGAYQLHKIYVDDVNRILGLWGYSHQLSYEDRWNKIKSRGMVGIYINYWAKYHLVDTWQLGMSNNEVRTRIHNGGPDGWKKESTKAYWLKVKERLEENN